MADGKIYANDVFVQGKMSQNDDLHAYEQLHVKENKSKVSEIELDIVKSNAGKTKVKITWKRLLLVVVIFSTVIAFIQVLIAILVLKSMLKNDLFELLPDYQTLKMNTSKKSTSQSKITFTTCGHSGPIGPSLSSCQSTYTDWSRNRTLFNVINGVQEWFVPETAHYVIDAHGAAGGNGNMDPSYTAGGRGTKIKGTFYLTAATILKIVVGQQGEDGGASEPGGGGGGSFVYTGSVGGSGLLVAAGGGGGNGEETTHPGYDGSSEEQAVNGNGFVGSSLSSNGGVGYGGLGGNFTTAGAGWKSDGGRHLGTDNGIPGKRWKGGSISSPTGSGGFGGGGSGVYTNGGGGGGGYTGGSGILLSNRTMWGGSGAGSFNSGINQQMISGSNYGDGFVIITKV